MPAERRTELLYYTAVDQEFFEPYERRPIDEHDFVAHLADILPWTWTMHRSGLWMHCKPPHAVHQAQGWKIHVSSALSSARVVLSITAAMLFASGTAFKFAADARIHAAMNGKRWPRGASGKFITVYPRDLADFQSIVARLQGALSGYEGPYILSDRRCPGSRVIHYRYGGIRGECRVSAGGHREYMLRTPDGGQMADMRAPYVGLPAWLRDPIAPSTPVDGAASPRLGDGRYEIRKALTFSSAGGIYLADDLGEGRRVVIKEARPHIGNATSALLKEFRLLRRLASLGVTPAPIQYFVEWEHHYLVEAYVEGQTLRLWLASRYPWLKTRATRADVAVFLDEVCTLFERLASALDIVHGAGISLGDPSFHNIMVGADGGVTFIDLEAAVEQGMDAPADLRTPGFASASPRRDSHAAAIAEDHYAFGANLFAAMMPVNAMLPLDRHAAMRFTRMISEDMGYPAAWINTIAALLHSDPSKRPAPATAVSRLRTSIVDLPRDDQPVTHRRSIGAPAPDVAAALFGYIDAMAVTARPDRYVPADPEVFERHPWGVAYGAAGVLHAYLRSGRSPPAGLHAYVLDGAQHGRDRGSDLMHGDAGIAWVLFDAGEDEVAATLLRESPLAGPILEHPGLYDGIAGWGMARIMAWQRTDDPAFLDAAIAAGDMLLAQASVEDGKLGWQAGATTRPVGIGQGAAGIALFLLHLSIATGDDRFMDAARAALAFDLDHHATNPDGEWIWRRSVGSATLLPYLRHGTAGVLAVVARFLTATDDDSYREILLAREPDLLRRHAVSPGLFDGLAGIGETLLDLAAAMPERAEFYISQAHHLAGGIDPFLLHREHGLAVPGTELLRLSCDFATGSAGVASFYDRLWRGGPASFMLDEQLPAGRRRQRPESPYIRNFASTR